MSDHIRLPVRVAPDGRFFTVAEDSVAEVLQNVMVILRTRLGERLATPALGTVDPTFGDFDAEAALSVVAEYEPRADLQVVRRALDALGSENVTVYVSRRET